MYRQRDEFLACLEVPEKLVSASDSASQAEGAWQFVTESLECESEDDQTMLKETDLIALYDQFPINDMFRHILMVSSDGEGRVLRDGYGCEGVKVCWGMTFKCNYISTSLWMPHTVNTAT